MFLDLLWDKSFASANRLIKDSHPYQIIKGENKDTIVVNALGVSEKDVKIEIKPSDYDDRTNYLYISGKTTNKRTNTDYSFSNRFSLNKLKVREIKYETIDGLLYVDIYYVEDPFVEIPISRRNCGNN